MLIGVLRLKYIIVQFWGTVFFFNWYPYTAFANIANIASICEYLVPSFMKIIYFVFFWDLRCMDFELSPISPTIFSFGRRLDRDFQENNTTTPQHNTTANHYHYHCIVCVSRATVWCCVLEAFFDSDSWIRSSLPAVLSALIRWVARHESGVHGILSPATGIHPATWHLIIFFGSKVF